MKLKNIFLLTVALIAVFTACQDDDYEMPNDLSAVAWYTSNFRSAEFQVNVNDFISFSDLSQNALSHNWTIPEGSYFLQGPISQNDSILDGFIIPNAGQETTDETIHVLFTKGGLQPVRLYNTFKEKVTFYGNDTIDAKQEGDVWVIDTTFMVDVFDTIVPEILIRQAGVQVPLGPDTIYVEAGGTLEFVDITSIGRPNTRFWNVAGTTSTDSVATILFKKLGVFSARFTSSRTGENIPTDQEQILIPNPIKVIPSSKPWELFGAIKAIDSENIRVVVSGEAAPFTGKEGDFTVHVANNGFNQDITVQSATVNMQDATIIELKLSERIYVNDTVTVSYVGNTITSVDERKLNAFTDESIVMYDANLFDSGIYGFETGHENWESTGMGLVEITNEKSFSGDYSLKLTSALGDVWTQAEATGDAAKTNLVPGTSYVLSWKMWRDPSSDHNVLGPWLAWDTGSLQFWTGLNALPKGEWVTITKEYDYAGTGATWFWVRVRDNNIIYFDDISIIEKSEFRQ